MLPPSALNQNKFVAVDRRLEPLCTKAAAHAVRVKLRNARRLNICTKSERPWHGRILAWGLIKQATWRWWLAYIDEAYVVLSRDLERAGRRRSELRTPPRETSAAFCVGGRG